MLARTSPALLGRTRWLLSLKDYLVLKLTGTACTDNASASYTQLFDVRQRQWSPDLARECGVPAHILPPVYPATALAGRVTGAAATATGLAGPGHPRRRGRTGRFDGGARRGRP